MLQATITVQDTKGNLEKIFSMEEKSFQNNRAKYDCKREAGKLKFDISAKDPTALRSVLNTITKILSVNDKAEQVLEDE